MPRRTISFNFWQSTKGPQWFFFYKHLLTVSEFLVSETFIWFRTGDISNIHFKYKVKNICCCFFYDVQCNYQDNRNDFFSRFSAASESEWLMNVLKRSIFFHPEPKYTDCSEISNFDNFLCCFVVP